MSQVSVPLKNIYMAVIETQTNSFAEKYEIKINVQGEKLCVRTVVANERASRN